MFMGTCTVCIFAQCIQEPIDYNLKQSYSSNSNAKQQQLLGGLGDFIVGFGVCLEGLNVLRGGLGGQL